jgi:gamma-D-glutamyl-L-lysine dipeptidyl-peptidase
MNEARIGVSVTSAWVSPDAARPIDSAITQDVPNPAAWCAALSHEARLDLLGRISTQALLNERVEVIDQHDGWSEVLLPSQPSGQSGSGYQAWIPSAHLVEPSATSTDHATIVDRLVFVRALHNGPPVDIYSMGTNLDVVEIGERDVVVDTPAGRRIVDRGSVRLSFDRTQTIGDGVVRQASKMLGLPYLWGGISGWGVDCSGLVHLSSRSLGSTVPRDSVDQRASYRTTSPKPEAGELLFFRYLTESKRIHHVAIATDAQHMIHAPRTGRVVELLPIHSPGYGEELERAL